MTEVTLDFIGAQLKRLLDDNAEMRSEIAGFRDDMRVITAMTLRIDNTLTRINESMERMNKRLRTLEDTAP